jgi:hypothetical protein
MKPMTTLADVLEWLASVEPERCWVNGLTSGEADGPPEYYTVYLGDDSGFDIFLDMLVLLDVAAAEYALRESIEAKGWLWSIDREFNGSFAASVSLHNPHQENKMLGVYVRDTPLLALANAYREAVG